MYDLSSCCGGRVVVHQAINITHHDLYALRSSASHGPIIILHEDRSESPLLYRPSILRISKRSILTMRLPSLRDIIASNLGPRHHHRPDLLCEGRDTQIVHTLSFAHVKIFVWAQSGGTAQTIWWKSYLEDTGSLSGLLISISGFVLSASFLFHPSRHTFLTRMAIGGTMSHIYIGIIDGVNTYRDI